MCFCFRKVAEAAGFCHVSLNACDALCFLTGRLRRGSWGKNKTACPWLGLTMSAPLPSPSNAVQALALDNPSVRGACESPRALP